VAYRAPFFKVGDERQWTFVRENSKDRQTPFLSHGRTGEILLYGGDEHATVHVGRPEYRGRQWLAAGETFTLRVWAEAEATIWYCGGDDLYLRTLQNGKPSSAWQRIGGRGMCEIGQGYIGHSVPGGAKAPGEGFIEVKAGKEVSWFKFLDRVTPPDHYYRLPAGKIVDTKIQLRPGDLFRITAGREAIYTIESRRERLVSAKQYQDQTAGSTGSLQLKAGLLDSEATVTVLARGTRWK